MRDKDLYQQILGIALPWRVTQVDLDLKSETVTVNVELEPGSELACPQCGQGCSGYDHRERRWRHLDTCQFRTVLVAQVPRVECAEHGVHQIAVPWAEPGSHFTALFEALVIDWLHEAPLAAVARRLSLSWRALAGPLQLDIALESLAVEAPPEGSVASRDDARREVRARKQNGKSPPIRLRRP